MHSPVLERLIKAFCLLPGVGERTARRMSYHLLKPASRAHGSTLAEALSKALEVMRLCKVCRNLTEHDVCSICQDKARSDEELCIVEQPADLMAIEQSSAYRGKYFVLMGRLSPIEGIGPEALGMEGLRSILASGKVKEVILATSATVEGQVTADYITALVQDTSQASVTKVAQGIAVGGELEYTDDLTLGHAFDHRQKVS